MVGVAFLMVEVFGQKYKFPARTDLISCITRTSSPNEVCHNLLRNSVRESLQLKFLKRLWNELGMIYTYIYSHTLYVTSETCTGLFKIDEGKRSKKKKIAKKRERKKFDQHSEHKDNNSHIVANVQLLEPFRLLNVNRRTNIQLFHFSFSAIVIC